MTATRALPAGGIPVDLPRQPSGIRSAYRVERRKLASQLAIRLIALVCVLGPLLFAVILKIQSGSPTDTLYGIWVHSSCFAVSLVLLSFAGSWGPQSSPGSWPATCSPPRIVVAPGSWS